MKKSFYLGLVLMLSVLLVTGCENPVQKVVDKAKDKVETSVDEKVKNTTDKVKNDVKKVVDSATSEKLVCSMSQVQNGMNMEMKVSLDYDTKLNQPKNISMEMNMNIGTEKMEAIKSSEMDLCSYFTSKDKVSGKCTSTYTNDSVQLTYEITESDMADLIKEGNNSEVHSFAELKAAFEKEGFKCN